MVCFCPTSVSRSPRPSLRSAFSNFLNILTRAWSGIWKCQKLNVLFAFLEFFEGNWLKKSISGSDAIVWQKSSVFSQDSFYNDDHDEWIIQNDTATPPPWYINQSSFRFTAKIWIGAIWYFDCCLQNACDGQLGPCESSLDSFDCLRTMEPSEEEM